MTTDANRHLTPPAVLLTIALCIVFGANPTAIKISLAGIGKFTVAGIRFALAALVIAAWARMTRRPFRLSAAELAPIAVISILFTLQLVFFYAGLSRTYASRGALISNMVPFFVSVLAHWFIPGDGLSRRKILGLLTGFAGVALILTDPRAAGSDLRTGDLIVLAGVFVWSCNAVYTKTVIDRFQPFQIVLYPMLFSTPVFLAAGWLWDGTMVTRLDWPVAAAVLYQSLICAAIGFVVWSWLLQRFGASALHSFIFIMPFSGVAAGSLLLGEPITHHIIAAAFLVTAGIALINIKAKPVQPPLPPTRL